MQHPPGCTATAIATAALLGSALSPLAARATEYADVVSATPVTVPVATPRQVCRNEAQIVQPGPSGAGAVIGAIAGAVLGHNVGAGFGRAAATGLGVVAGAVIGDQIEASNTPTAEVAVRRCQTVSRIESRVVGYDVMYDFGGQRYSTRMARDPGDRMAVELRPVEAGNDRLPVPLAARADAEAQWSQAAPVPAPGALPALQADPQAVYPQTIYSEPYYLAAPPAVYLSPFIGFGLGYVGGYYGGHYGGHYGGYSGGHYGGHYGGRGGYYGGRHGHWR